MLMQNDDFLPYGLIPLHFEWCYGKLIVVWDN